MIRWVGESDYWKPFRREGPWTMPLVEEAVLDVAYHGQGRHLSPRAAVNCTSRLALRVALAGVGLNPRWQPLVLLSGDQVVKASASTLSEGVREFPVTEMRCLLEEYVPELSRFGVVEERMSGPQWEQDGWIVGGKTGYFYPLVQSWEDGRIVQYRRDVPPYPGFREAVEKAVRAVGLDDCPFCCELRFHRNVWRIVEINARFGEDEGLAELMWDTNPLHVIERAADS